ncbi:hypothetical protein ACFE04_019134 [Oxalis oulophora]
MQLPQDVVINILLRLPVKSLNRFVCVCKSWYKIIKNNTFIQQQHHQGEELLLLLSNYSKYDRDCHSTLFKFISNDLTTFVDQDFFNTLPFDSYNYSIHGHCNGLFCLFKEENRVALWNPANKEIKLLPHFPREYTNQHCLYFGLQFGWDQRIDDYTVVVFLEEHNYNSDTHLCVYIYSLNNDSWRHFKGYVPLDGVDFDSNLCLDGVFYWLQNMHYDGTIISFRISDDVFEEITGPNCLTKSVFLYTALDKYNGHVAIIVGGMPWSDNSIDVYVLVSENCWNKVVSCIGPSIENFSPLGIWEHGEIILDGEGSCHIYDPRTQQLNDQVVCPDGNYIKRSYKESLVSLKKIPRDFDDVIGIANLFM